MARQAVDNGIKVAEVSLVYRTNVKAAERPVVRSAGDAYRIFKEHWDTDQIELLEESKLLLLNRSNKVLGICNLSKGGVSATVVDPKLVFALALKANASSIILAHNHPSGLSQPGNVDHELTQKLCKAAQLLDIKFLDNLIITKEAYYSMADVGEL